MIGHGDDSLDGLSQPISRRSILGAGGVIAASAMTATSTLAQVARLPKEILICFSVDVDAVAGWIGSYGGADDPDDISRGMFAGEIGVLRLLDFFKRRNLKTTFFTPGHSAETFPEQMHKVVEAGHEIAVHGYTHENPLAMSPQQETDVLDRSIAVLKQLSGKAPTGYAAPFWEFSKITAELLLSRGIRYDHSLMHRDFEPYYVRTGDSWTKVDYKKPAAEWMKPLRRGSETDLIELPSSWYLDDMEPLMFIKAQANSKGYVSPQAVEQLWRDQFDWVYREMDYAVFTATIHPDVSGHPQNLLMLERLFAHIEGHPGVRFMTMNDIAEDYRRRSPRQR